MSLIRKQSRTDSRLISESKRIIRFVGSTEAVDRDGDKIKQDGWVLKNYRKNPVVLFGHDYGTRPVARTVKVGVKDKKLVFDVQFPKEEDAGTEWFGFSDSVYRLIKSGYLHTVSVGFLPVSRPKWVEGADGKSEPRRIFEKNELLELSVVPVPANPEALAAALGKKNVSQELSDLLTLPPSDETALKVAEALSWIKGEDAIPEGEEGGGDDPDNGDSDDDDNREEYGEEPGADDDLSDAEAEGEEEAGDPQEAEPEGGGDSAETLMSLLRSIEGFLYGLDVRLLQVERGIRSASSRKSLTRRSLVEARDILDWVISGIDPEADEDPDDDLRFPDADLKAWADSPSPRPDPVPVPLPEPDEGKSLLEVFEELDSRSGDAGGPDPDSDVSQSVREIIGKLEDES